MIRAAGLVLAAAVAVNIRRAYAIRERTYGKESTDTASLLISIGNVYHAQKDYAAALDAYQSADPLLRSGIALAGANLARQRDAGILTALEASTLNLWGTKLVTLSACDTGIGAVRNGEGVYGLRRAFFLAGAQTLVMSLWPVSDYVTRTVMTDYYGGLARGLGREAALRRVQLAMLSDPQRRHPFYWAAFIQAGDWTPLPKAR
jgi:hypothetical protein